MYAKMADFTAADANGDRASPMRKSWFEGKQ